MIFVLQMLTEMMISVMMLSKIVTVLTDGSILVLLNVLNVLTDVSLVKLLILLVPLNQMVVILTEVPHQLVHVTICTSKPVT